MTGKVKEYAMDKAWEEVEFMSPSKGQQVTITRSVADMLCNPRHVPAIIRVCDIEPDCVVFYRQCPPDDPYPHTYECERVIASPIPFDYDAWEVDHG